MIKVSSTLSILFQVAITFFVLFFIYMIHAFFDTLEIDMIAGIGFLIFQPILGFVITSLTIIACLLVGLPIRLIDAVHRFWLSKPFLPLLGAAAGMALMLLAYNNHFTELKEVTIDYGTIQKEIPGKELLLSGWLFTAFSLLHFYPQSLLVYLRSKKNKVV